MALFSMGAQTAPMIAQPRPPSSGWDKLALLGATLQDVGSSLNGGHSDAISNQQALMIARAQAVQRQKALQDLGGLFGSGAAPAVDATAGQVAPPSPGGMGSLGGVGAAAPSAPASPQRRAGPDLSDPDVQRRLFVAAAQGVPGAKELIDMLKTAQPDVAFTSDGQAYNKKDPGALALHVRNPTNVNNMVLDLNDPKSVGQYVPEAPTKGAAPVRGPDGGIMDWQLPEGARAAIGQAAAAQAAGQGMGGAPYQPDNRTGPDGAPIYGTVRDRFDRPPGLGGGGLAGRPPGLVGQSTADRVSVETEAKARAEAATAAQLSMSQTVQQAQQSLTLIDQIKNHPSLGNRTGLLALAPAIPGTPGADFDAMTSQLKGKVFLTAYSDLKGAGAITEQEGKVATAAIARLNQGQSKAGYLAALKDLEDVIKSGVGRAQQKAGADGGGRAPAAPARSDVEAELRRRGLLR